MEQIANTVGCIVGECNDGATALDLYNAMNKWSTKHDRSWRSLMRVPGFAKLWRAIYDGAEQALVNHNMAPPALMQRIEKEMGMN